MKITFKKLTECTIQDVIMAWNKGFEGYFVQMEMTPELFFNRLVNEGLSLTHSFVAFDQEEPVAIVLNGFRVIKGKKTAWNGGTGIAVDYRGKGVSRLIMEEALKIYSEEGSEVATLEAIKENERAIRLYERFGYQITDSLVYLSGFPEVKEISILTQSIRPEQLPSFSFYNENVSWQCQWQSVKSGEAQVYLDKDRNPLGYSLFKRVWNQEGQLEKVFLFQFELFGEVTEESIQAVFAAISEGERNPVCFITINASLSNPVIQYLLDHGFKKTTEQVQMVKNI
ncbi:GNAT family N-acetyltransferase [Neobacillus sp.]|uniref:GNAT family N-acetyltransferase n=1 Tax=Neobacillus sp. TaxID=2675273 RepID=UPI00289E5BF0|nr:GNAT family N-acetyltransferase [Neobacillus sp.]